MERPEMIFSDESKGAIAPQILAIVGVILSSSLVVGDGTARAEVTASMGTFRPARVAQTSGQQTSQGALKTWCSQAGGTWLGQYCQWQDLLEEEREFSLNRQCSDRGGIWQTLYEETIGPSICGSGFCTADAVVIDEVETGVGCVWQDTAIFEWVQ